MRVKSAIAKMSMSKFEKMTINITKQFNSLDDALNSLFGGGQIAKKEPVAGGDINQAYKLTLNDGTAVFLKTNSQACADFFAAEAVGLSAIAETGAIGVPQVLAYGCTAGDSFLLMEYVHNSRRNVRYWETFGQQLAAMHTADTKKIVSGSCFGFMQNNYIGMRQQINTPYAKWCDFFRDCRLAPQFQQAKSYFDKNDLIRIDKLVAHSDNYLVEPEVPALLHGDLWSGNFITGNDGWAWLIDPAVYVGHAEADIAMTELFGGFPADFYAAYNEVAPLQPGYKQRRDLYNLYHLLNHLNMFGGSYLGAVKTIIQKYAK